MTPPPMTDQKAISRFLALPGRRLHWLEWGKADAPTVVLVHGLRDHARSWDFISMPLAEAGYRVIATDLRGHGDSDRTGAYNLADYVRDLAAIMASLGPSPVDLVGHSLGGQISLRYTASFPETVARLCVIEGVELPIVREHRENPRPYPQRQREWIDRETAWERHQPRHYPSIEAARARMAAEHTRIDAETIAHITQHGVVRDAEGWRWKHDSAARYRAPDDPYGIALDEMLAAIPCPTLLCYGTASWVPLPPPARLALIRNHRIATFPDASHWLHHEARGAFLDILTEFLAAPAHLNPTPTASERSDNA